MTGRTSAREEAFSGGNRDASLRSQRLMVWLVSVSSQFEMEMKTWNLTRTIIGPKKKEKKKDEDDWDSSACRCAC